MEEQYDNEQFLNPQPVRPTMLSVLCVLSFINSVWNAFCNLTIFGVYNIFNAILEDDEMLEQIMDVVGEVQYDEMLKVYEMMFSVDKIYYLLSSFLYIGAFVGVLYMWKMKRNGFHIYAIAQILILIVAALFYYVPMGMSPWGDVIMTAIFIFWYYTFYKKEMN